jgi:hypothetical protein
MTDRKLLELAAKAAGAGGEVAERYRVEPTGRGFWPFCVRAGDGERELFVGHRKACERVAAELATAFEDGKFVGSRTAAPSAPMGDV